MHIVLVLQLLLQLLRTATAEEGPTSQVYEEYHIDGPNEVHSTAVKHYLEVRARDPNNFNLSDDSPVMIAARKYAEQRLFVPTLESMTVPKKTMLEIGFGGNAEGSQLNLPAPNEPTDYLTQGMLTVQSESSEVMSLEVANSLSLAMLEDISMGAIAQAGALAVGEKNWITFAENRVKKEHQLDHQSLLWHMGSQQIEEKQANRSNVNTVSHKERMEKMKSWFLQSGGKISYGDIHYDIEKDLHRMTALEDVHEDDVVLTIPIALTMCRITSRNVLVRNKGTYLGEQLKKTFEKNEIWGLAIFLLHEWFKENAEGGGGSKWGPFINTLMMRSMTTPVVKALEGTTSVEIMKNFMKDAEGLRMFSTEIDGPCGYTKGVCRTKPGEKLGNDGRFETHHLRWAYWVVVQNAVRVHQASTGGSFLALIPFANTMKKSVSNSTGVVFGLSGSVSVKASSDVSIDNQISFSAGNFNDAEFFSRYYEVPDVVNPFNAIKLALPGTLKAGSKFNFCLKDPKAARKDECRDGSYRGESMMWRSKVLGEWRKLMNMPPRLSDIRMWATRLHIFGDTPEEEKLLSAANQMIAGLPIPVDVMPAEEQLMLLGMAKNNDEASLIVLGPQGGERPMPQLYSAPDPTEDPEAERAMEHLALLAVQLQNSLATGSDFCNATKVVLNETRDFFQHGVLPKPGLDELDQYLLKKLGMISHCGVDKDMLILSGNITKELMCAMRVYLMNETEIHTFCPARIRYFEDNCQQVEFMNYTAVSLNNELSVISAFRSSLYTMLKAFSTSQEEDREILREYDSGISSGLGPIHASAVRLRLREKALMISAIEFLDSYEESVKTGAVEFQLEMKIKEREVEDLREKERQKFAEEVKMKAAIRDPLVVLPVDLGPNTEPGLNITIREGDDLIEIIRTFCIKYGVATKDVGVLETSLRNRIVHPQPLALLMGVVVPSGERKILSVAENANSTFETHVFCAKNGVDEFDACERVLKRVEERLNPTSFTRRILLVVPVDAPDGRKIKLIVREGEQHDLIQHVGDFLELYHMSRDNTLGLANEVHKRLPSVSLQIPVSTPMRRQVSIRFSDNENITNVIEAFSNFYDIDSSAKVQILKMARAGMAPGTFVV